MRGPLSLTFSPLRGARGPEEQATGDWRLAMMKSGSGIAGRLSPVAIRLFLPLPLAGRVGVRAGLARASARPRLVVVLGAEVRDQLLAAQVAERVLQLHQLDEQVVLRVQAGRG